MKILVADDDALIRRLLLALLAKLGHEVEVVEEGCAAQKALEVANPPDLAILDWVMPGINGLEICRKLRAQNLKSRTYVLLLSAKTDRNDVIAGLYAGADDYLVKPFDPMALLARLRVAQRAIAYQRELQQHIVDMEALLKRYNLLGELFSKQGRGDSSEPGGLALPVPSPIKLVAERVNEMLIRGLAEVGLGKGEAHTLEKNQETPQAVFSAWAPMILVPEGLWVDFLLDVDDSSAVAQFEALLGRIPVSERELLDFLAETFNLLCTTLKTALTTKGSSVFMPVISRSMRTANLNIRVPAAAQLTRHRLTLPGIELVVSLIRQAAPILSKSLGQLREFDILAENLPSPSTKEVFLLNQGVVLNARYIEKLVALAQEEKKEIRVPVIAPSPLAEFFCLGRIAAT